MWCHAPVENVEDTVICDWVPLELHMIRHCAPEPVPSKMIVHRTVDNACPKWKRQNLFEPLGHAVSLTHNETVRLFDKSKADTLLVVYTSVAPPANTATVPRVASLEGDPPVPDKVAPVGEESPVMLDEFANL